LAVKRNRRKAGIRRRCTVPQPPCCRYPADKMMTVAVGDVHGCGVELRGLLAAIDRHLPGASIILVGDLLTKGPTPAEVIREILDQREAGRDLRIVCGNHDLRLLAALVRVQSGISPDQLPKAERSCWHALARHGMLRLGMRLMVEATETVEIRDRSGWTVMHGGIDPTLGLDETPDDVKIHIKALEGQPHWWERYDGSDGLIVVGHKPLPAPLVLRNEQDKPYVVNIDTGCVYGGHLTAYSLDTDTILTAPSVIRGLRNSDEVAAATRIIAKPPATPLRVAHASDPFAKGRESFSETGRRGER